MDITNRRITKIAREAEKLAVQAIRVDGVGTAEFDLVHYLRHHPGSTQAELREALHIDKGAAARRTASLEAKGFLRREENPADGRSQLLFATEKAEGLKLSLVSIESIFYEWLVSDLSGEDRAGLVRILEALGHRAHQESRAGFPNVKKLLEERGAEE